MRGLRREVRTKEGDRDSGRTVKKKSQTRDRRGVRKGPGMGCLTAELGSELS